MNIAFSRKTVLAALTLCIHASAVANPEFRLVMSVDRNLCAAVLSAYRESDYRMLDDKILSNFGIPEWRALAGDRYYGEYAYFDIDNDGEEEAVVRKSRYLHQVPFDVLIIRRKSEFDRSDISMGDGSKGRDRKVDTTRGGYPLTSYDGRPVVGERSYNIDREFYRSTGAIKTPFKFNGKFYLAMRDPSIVKDDRWVIVVEYLGGGMSPEHRDRDATKDYCYIRQVG